MQTICIDLANKTVFPTIYAKQMDVGRKFRIVLTESGLTYEIPKNSVFSVWYSGTSGEGNYSTVGDRDAITVNRNEVTVELITEMLSNPGGGKLCLVLSSNDGDQIGTWNMPYAVEALPGMGSPAAEQYYTALSEVASKAAESAVVAKQAVEYVDSKFKGKAGLVYPLATNTVPDGFLLCDGAEYSRTEYPELFSAIGTVYGAGDGESTFNVPNLSTRVPVGAGEGYALGATGGEEKHTLTENEMPAHSHRLTPLLQGDSAPQYTTGQYTTILTADNLVAPNKTVNAHTGVFAGESQAAGGSQPHNIMQPYTVVNYIISTGKEMEFVVGRPVSGGASVELDTTLTQEGKAADAKAVGDKLGDIDTALDGIIEIQNSLIGGDAV